MDQIHPVPHFTISPFPFLVKVYLVCCYIQKRFDTFTVSYTLKYIYSSHYIGVICICRIFIAIPYNRLCSKMEYYLRLCLIKCRLQAIIISYISEYRIYVFFISAISYNEYSFLFLLNILLLLHLRWQESCTAKPL